MPRFLARFSSLAILVHLTEISHLIELADLTEIANLIDVADLTEIARLDRNCALAWDCVPKKTSAGKFQKVAGKIATGEKASQKLGEENRRGSHGAFCVVPENSEVALKPATASQKDLAIFNSSRKQKWKLRRVSSKASKCYLPLLQTHQIACSLQCNTTKTVPSPNSLQMKTKS